MVDVSKQIENKCDISESSQNVHKLGENVLGNFFIKIYNFTGLVKVVLVYVFSLSDNPINYSDNMSEQVNMIEIITEPNELFSTYKITRMVADSMNDETTYESMNHIFLLH